MRYSFALFMRVLNRGWMVAVMVVFAANGWAQNFGTLATISDTLGVNAGRICLGEASRQDIGCPTYAPSVSTGGLLTATSIATGGLTVTGATSMTTLSATVVQATSFIGDGSGLTNLSVSGDRITSGTDVVTVNDVMDTVSFTLGGATTAYMHPTIGLVAPGVSTTGAIAATSFRTPGAISASVVSVTALQIVSQSTGPVTCNSGNAGTLRYSSTTTSLQLCTGTGWQPMGVGIPAGTISAFASTTCPTGWSEYTAARGRFLRGIDNGAGNDPDGTRAPGATQADMLGSHTHTIPSRYNPSSWPGGGVFSSDGGGSDVGTSSGSSGGTETRPKNVAVIFCQFNGTSNGWNNPLSGGSTTAAGSTGQLQFNTGNSFDASSNLTWTNASSLLTINGTLSATNVYGLNVSGTNGFFPAATISALSAGAIAANSVSSALVSATNISGTNISATRLTVNGVAITGTGTSRLASLTDVSLSNLTGLDILRYNGTSWTNVNVQNAMSTTTMVSNWPDAIRCDVTNSGNRIFYLGASPASSGSYVYREVYYSIDLAIVFNSSGVITSFTYGSESSTNCGVGQTMASLYANGRAFNFIGTAPNGIALDRISTSGVSSGASLGMAVASAGTISFTLGGTAGAAYLHPTLGLVGPGVSTTGRISATSVYVSASLGVGITTPTMPLHVVSTNGNTARLTSTGGGTSWLYFNDNSAATDVLLGSQSGGLSIQTGGSGRMTINASGNVGIGSAPNGAYVLAVGPGSQNGILAKAASSGHWAMIGLSHDENTIGYIGNSGIGVYGYSASGGGNGVLGNNVYSGYYCYIGTPSAAIACSGPSSGVSDQRLKKDIRPLDTKEGLAAVMKLKPVHYLWKDTRMNRARPDGEIGFLAQNVEEVLPDLVGDVTQEKNAPIKLPGMKSKSLQYERLIAPAVLAIQQLKAENDSLRADNEKLRAEFKAEIEALRHEMKALRRPPK